MNYLIFSLACLYALFTGVVFVEPSPAEIVFIAFVLLFVIHYGVPAPNSTFLILSSIFIVANILLVPVGGNISFGIFTTGIRAYLLLVVVFFSVYLTAFDERGLNIFLKCVVVGGILNCAVIILALIVNSPLLDFVYRDEYRLRFKGLFEDPNVMGPHLVFCFSLLLFYFKGRLMPLLSIIVAFTVILSYSRASWLGLLMIPFIVLIFRIITGQIGIKLSKLAFVGILVVLFSTIGGAYIGNSHPELLDYFSKRAGFQDYDSDRFAGQSYAIDLFIDSLVGYGPGSTVSRADGIMPVNDPHNVYLKLFVETGLIGGLSFLFILIYVLIALVKLAIKRSNLAAILVANLIYIITIGMVIDTTHWRLLYLILALGLALPAFEWRSNNYVYELDKC